MSSEIEIKVGHLVTWADDDAAKKYGGALGDIEGDPRERETREVVEIDMGRGGRGCALLRDGLAYQWVPLWRLRHAAPMQVHQVDRVRVETVEDGVRDLHEVTAKGIEREGEFYDIQLLPTPTWTPEEWARCMGTSATYAEMTKDINRSILGTALTASAADGTVMVAVDFVAADPEPSGNEDCPRCGGRRLVLLDTVEHVGPCETADDVVPDALWSDTAWTERHWHVRGRGIHAQHPTRDGAIAAWREKLRERGMR